MPNNALFYYPFLLLSTMLGMFAAIIVFLQVVGYVGVPLLIGLPLLAYLLATLLAIFLVVRFFPPRGRRLLWSNLALLAFGPVFGVLLYLLLTYAPL